MHAQLSHSISLNDICDCLGNHRGALASMRKAVAPTRNTLSHANRVRNADMAEALFWEVLDELKRMCPGFALYGRNYCGIPRRFKRVINVVDSTTLRLVANCLDWAKHRRRKAAAKMHLDLYPLFRTLSYAAFGMIALAANCTGDRYPSAECNRTLL